MIRDSGDPASFVCPACDRRSSNPNDIAERYCGACHWWTGDPAKAWQRPDLFAAHGKTPPAGGEHAAGGTQLPDPTLDLTARLHELEQTARAAAVDAGGSRWYHYDYGYDVYAKPLNNPVAVGPYGCGLSDTGTHIAGHDPHAVMTLCREVRGLIRDYDRAAEIARRASQQVQKPPPADPTVWPEPIMVTGATKSSRRPTDNKDTATGCIARGAGDRVVDQTRGYAAGIHHALAVLLAALTPPPASDDSEKR